MPITRFQDSAGQIHVGLDQGDNTALRIEGDVLANHTVTRQLIPIHKRLAPIAPAAILCIGLNYRKHAEETGAAIPQHPVLFMKNPAALQNPGDPIVLPNISTQVDWECELAIVIGKRCKNISRDKAEEVILGYTAANDVSARDWQKQWGGTQWCRGKSFDTFCPLGPSIFTPKEMGNPNGLAIQTRVNGQLMQDANTSDMIFDVPTLVAFLSASTTLLPGTVILTGTPSGVGAGRNPPVYLKAGDKVEVVIEGIGTLSNTTEIE